LVYNESIALISSASNFWRCLKYKKIKISTTKNIRGKDIRLQDVKEIQLNKRAYVEYNRFCKAILKPIFEIINKTK